MRAMRVAISSSGIPFPPLRKEEHGSLPANEAANAARAFYRRGRNVAALWKNVGKNTRGSINEKYDSLYLYSSPSLPPSPSPFFSPTPFPLPGNFWTLCNSLRVWNLGKGVEERLRDNFFARVSPAGGVGGVEGRGRVHLDGKEEKGCLRNVALFFSFFFFFFFFSFFLLEKEDFDEDCDVTVKSKPRYYTLTCI